MGKGPRAGGRKAGGEEPFNAGGILLIEDRRVELKMSHTDLCRAASTPDRGTWLRWLARAREEVRTGIPAGGTVSSALMAGMLRAVRLDRVPSAVELAGRLVRAFSEIYQRKPGQAVALVERAEERLDTLRDDPVTPDPPRPLRGRAS